VGENGGELGEGGRPRMIGRRHKVDDRWACIHSERKEEIEGGQYGIFAITLIKIIDVVSY
jgi:hypothetical protein